MSLTSSIVYALAEPDGSKHVHEQHADQAGKIYTRFYHAAPGDDLAANMAAYAEQLTVILAEQEADEVLSG